MDVEVDGNDITIYGTQLDTSFAHNSSIVTLTLIGTFERIPNFCFFNCSNLHKISMSHNIMTIGDYAFYNCSNLEEVDISRNLLLISSYSFAYCNRLSTINFPETLTEIGNNAFYYCQSLQSLRFPYSVKTISDYAFYQCANITNITFSYSLEFIGKSAFSNMNLLKSLEFFGKLKIIDDYAFYNCRSVNKIELSDNIEVIGKQVFYGSKATINNKLPSKLRIMNDLFKDKKDLTSITLPNTLEVIGDDCFANSGLSMISIPDSVIEIGESAFEYTRITSVILPRHVTRIKNYAFIGCRLNNFVLPDTVEYIGRMAFYNINLQEIRIPKSVKELGRNSFPSNVKLIFDTDSTKIIKYQYSGYRVDRELEIQEGIKHISSYGISECELLEVLTLPSTLEYLENYAIYENYGLRRITFRSRNVIFEPKSIELNFYYYDHIHDHYPYDPLFRRIKMTFTQINENEITPFQFFAWNNITNFVVPDNIIKIGYSAFAVSSLRSIEFNNKVKIIPSRCFYQCKNLERIVLKEGLKSIEPYAIEKCHSLSNVNFPDSLTSLGCYFVKRSSIESISFGPKIRIIPENFFEDNNYLKNVTFPSNLKEIRQYAFSDCYQLSSVIIPDSVEIIGNSAFSGCPITSFSFNKTRIIGNRAFSGCRIESITLSNHLESIQAYAFQRNHHLETIVIPQTINRIEEGTFINCRNLTNIVFEGCIEYLGNECFFNTKITTLTIPSFQTFYFSCIKYCYNLQTIKFGDNITSIVNIVKHDGSYYQRFIDRSTSEIYDFNEFCLGENQIIEFQYIGTNTNFMNYIDETFLYFIRRFGKLNSNPETSIVYNMSKPDEHAIGIKKCPPQSNIFPRFLRVIRRN